MSNARTRDHLYTFLYSARILSMSPASPTSAPEQENSLRTFDGLVLENGDPDALLPLSLLDLPVELLDLLAEHLDSPSLTSLRWTCRALHNILDMPPIDDSDHGKAAHLLNMERWPLYSMLWVCTSCVRLRPARKFTAGMIQHKRAKGAAGAKNRVCADCGVEKGTYEKGNLLRFASASSRSKDEQASAGRSDAREWGIICRRCGKLKVVDKDSTAALRRKCDPCMQYRPPGSIWQRDIRMSVGVKPTTSDELRLAHIQKSAGPVGVMDNYYRHPRVGARAPPPGDSAALSVNSDTVNENSTIHSSRSHGC